ncbi:carboxylating nicotinate-nucleotide diphosphorylase [Shouchella shacheensis]|uniref:carboxylating nicotinate-nucleotide diphosphorylase n=1 Tax=Shouchella shacheensis TaxID=1649580 RepID=UPI0007400BE4|nr:carboxylating nicotinate-nucleotide diphosphorylase [Shouchella shacheensis]
MNGILLNEQLKAFLSEDIGSGDATGEAIFQGEEVTASIIAKQPGVFAGRVVLERLYSLLDPRVEVNALIDDGQKVFPKERIATITGPAHSILSGERVLLNLLQRMSGIATMTNSAVEALADEAIRLCDTRKTTPGLRMFEKEAVRAGGGFNHRRGLDDAIMLKENHIAACGSITEAVRRIKAGLGPMMKIEVETTNEAEVIEAVEVGVDVIMFDNASPDEVKQYRSLVPSPIVTEASGGMTMATLPDYAGTSVDYISLGFLTHSTKALDFSMLVQKEAISW